MGSPTSDDDPTRPGGQPPGQGGWPPPGQQGGQYPPPGQGGQYPPPGQGQYPPPGQYPAQGPGTAAFPPSPPPGGGGPAPTAQFPAVGGFPGGPYPPGGPGGPYPPQGPGGGYGAPPPDGRKGKRGLLIAVVAGLVVLAALAVALVIAFTRDGGERVAADRSGTTSAAPSTSASPTPSESSAAPSPSESPDRTDELLATVPADFPDCSPSDLAGDGDVAAVVCGPSTTQPGPQDGTFYLYEDAATLDRVFAADSSGLEPLPEGEDCSTAQGVTTWNVDGVEGGEIACTITEDGLLLAWTDREFGIEGIVTAPGSTQEELAALAQWWSTNSDYQG